MIDESYCWVVAISNRREYIENELAAGNPTIGLSFSDRMLLLTDGRDRRKIFEIYDRICGGYPPAKNSKTKLKKRNKKDYSVTDVLTQKCYRCSDRTFLLPTAYCLLPTFSPCSAPSS